MESLEAAKRGGVWDGSRAKWRDAHFYAGGEVKTAGGGLLACNTHRVPSCVGKGEGGGMSGLSHPDPDTGVLLSGEETTLTF